MELIINTTGYCNFSCTFCSAAKLPMEMKKYERVPDKIVDLIKTIKPTNIIALGGDPLMVEPDYYYHMHDISNCCISMTSNLKSFFINPEKWSELLKKEWIGMTTSFQYGNGRRWDKNTVYTEAMFRDVYNLYKKLIGKNLSFIAVINEENEDTVLDLCKLAKSLGTVVKINNVLAEGLQDTTYPRYKIFKKYIEIEENGYGEYEYYCKNKLLSQCPFNSKFSCKNNIRSCYLDNLNNLHYMSCDHKYINESNILDYNNDHPDNLPHYPIMSDHVTKNCWKCNLFELCNGCESQRSRYPEEHCAEMKKLMPKLIKYGWATEKGLI